MRRIWILLLCVLLTGCAGTAERKERTDWDTSWFRFGDQVAAETPEGFELNESNDILSVSGLYYATWTAGEGEPFTNAQGREAVLYDAQIYMLLKECGSAEEAEADIADWTGREDSAYETEHGETNAQGYRFTKLLLKKARSENPYDHGAAAFGVIGTNAVSVEVLCRKTWNGDPEAVLETFLHGLHD